MLDRIKGMPLRVRLTVLYSAMLAVVLTVFGVSTYWAFSSRQYSQLNDALSDRAAEIQRSARLRAGSVVLRDLSVGRPGTFIQVVASDGSVVLRSDNLGNVTLPLTSGDTDVRTVASGQSEAYFTDVQPEGAPEMRMLVVPIRGPFDSPAGAVQIAVPLTDVAETLGRLRLVLVLAGLGGITLAGLAGWRMAFAALRPLDEVAGTALEIGRTQDLTRRVAAGGEDELGRMVAAFNGMLDRLAEARAELERTLEGQRRFLADVSHELRTPLTTMRGNMEVTLRDAAMSKKERAAAISDALAEAERMSRMVDDLLALARSGAASTESHRERVALTALVTSAVDAARARADGLALTLRLDGDPAVWGDPDKLRRLVDNLLDNAIKYTPEGEVLVWLRRDGDEAVVRVEDTGPGMTPEEAERAFERFWRGDHARGEPGSGLGLAIVRAVAEEHGGSVTLDSAPGKGTALTVRLPGDGTSQDPLSRAG